MNCKLSDAEVREIRRKLELRERTRKELAYDFKISYQTVGRIGRGERREIKATDGDSHLHG